MSMRASGVGQEVPAPAIHKLQKRSPQHQTSSVSSVLLQDALQVGRHAKHRQLKFQGNTQPQEDFLNVLVKRIIDFFGDILKAFSKLIGSSNKPASRISLESNEIRKGLDRIANHAGLHAAMEETGQRLEQMAPKLSLAPEQQAFLKEQAALMKTPEGRKAIIQKPFMEALSSGKAVQQYFMWLAELNRQLDMKDGNKVVELLAPDSQQEDEIASGYEGDDEADTPISDESVHQRPLSPAVSESIRSAVGSSLPLPSAPDEHDRPARVTVPQ